MCREAETTYNYNKIKDLVEIISKKGYDITVLDTICYAVKRLADHACNNTYYIQTLDDFDMNQLRSVETVGITAGASTPNKIIEEVQNNVRIIF